VAWLTRFATLALVVATGAVIGGSNHREATSISAARLGILPIIEILLGEEGERGSPI